MLAEVRMARIVEAIGRRRLGALSCVAAAQLLGMSERHFRRLRGSYDAGGAERPPGGGLMQSRALASAGGWAACQPDGGPPQSNCGRGRLRVFRAHPAKPVDLRCDDEIVLVQAMDFMRLQRDRDVTPAEADIGVVPFALSQVAH